MKLQKWWHTPPPPALALREVSCHFVRCSIERPRKDLKPATNRASDMEMAPGPVEPGDEGSRGWLLIAALGKTWSHRPSTRHPRSLRHRNHEIIKVCCLEPLSLGMICYAAREANTPRGILKDVAPENLPSLLKQQNLPPPESCLPHKNKCYPLFKKTKNLSWCHFPLWLPFHFSAPLYSEFVTETKDICIPYL